MSLNIYLTFNGDCRDAFDFYKSVFGGDYMAFETFAKGPPEMKIADADKDKVMHVSLPVGSSTLMGSDTAEGFGDPHAPGNNFSISVDADSREHCEAVMAKLSAGGEITIPASSTNTILKVLVVVLIVWVAYWAATGGIDEIVVNQPSSTSTTTSVSE